MAMGVIEGVMRQQLLQHRSQLRVSECCLAWIVCSTLFNGISNFQFLGFQWVPCVALGSALSVSSLSLPLLHLGKH